MKKKKTLSAFARKDGLVNVIVETSKGSRNKYAYDHNLRILTLKKILPCGMVFPFDFGSIPSTLAPDGDPLDILVLMEDPVSAPCLVQAHLIGVIRAEQTDDEKTERNDRLIAISESDNRPAEESSLKKLDKDVIKEIEHFFVSYNELDCKKFKILDCEGPKAAIKLVKQGEKEYKRKS